MIKFLFAIVVAVTAAFPTLAQAETPRADRAQAVASSQDKKFSWTGSVQVRCTNGECKLVSSNGVVFALDSATAKIRAEANLRAEAGRQGVAVEGSFSVTVRAEFMSETEDALVAGQVVFRNSAWTTVKVEIRRGNQLPIEKNPMID